MISIKKQLPPLSLYVLIYLRNRDLEWHDSRDQKGVMFQVALFNGQYFETFGSNIFDICDVLYWKELPIGEIK